MLLAWLKLFVLVAAAAFAALGYFGVHPKKEFGGAAVKATADGKKDCYFDKACHDKVDWDTVARLKQGFFVRSKVLFARSHHAFAVAGVPEDRIDYILLKWAKAIDPAVPKDAWKGAWKADSKDCFFDAECHKKADWEQVGVVKAGFFTHLKTLVKHMHHMLAGAGMPADRIDSVVFKWLYFVGSGKADVAAFHATRVGGRRFVGKTGRHPARKPGGKMTWDMIGRIKHGFFLRLKALKAEGRAQDVKMLMQRARGPFVKAGVPEDKVDRMLAKWVAFVYPEALGAPDDKQATTTIMSSTTSTTTPATTAAAMTVMV